MLQHKLAKEMLDTPPNLPLGLLMIDKAVQRMSHEYFVCIPITQDLVGLLDDHMFATKEDIIQFLRMEQIGASMIASYMKYVTNFVIFYDGQLKSMLY